MKTELIIEAATFISLSLQRVQSKKNVQKWHIELIPTSSFPSFCFRVSEALNRMFHSVKKNYFHINGKSPTSLTHFVNFYVLTHSFFLLPQSPSGKIFPQAGYLPHSGRTICKIPPLGKLTAILISFSRFWTVVS